MNLLLRFLNVKWDESQNQTTSFILEREGGKVSWKLMGGEREKGQGWQGQTIG